MFTRIKKAVRRLQSDPQLGKPLREALQYVDKLRGVPMPLPVPMPRRTEPERPEKLLFIADYNPQGIPTIIENIESWCALSKFRIDVLNLNPQRPGALRIPDAVDLEAYDGLIIHCTVSYNIRNLITLDEARPQKISHYQGLKIVFKQDEHYKPGLVAEYIGRHDVHGVITMCRPQDVEIFYPPAKTGNPRFMHALTGYVSDNMLGLTYPATDARKIDIGYRGSLQPLSFGRLAWEKREIGDRFIPICQSRGLAYDISSRPEARILGSRWFDFLGGLKGVLGVESGASIVDFDGEVERKVLSFERRHPDEPFEELYESVLRPYENNAYYKAIAPRHFEAAATKTVQIMYEGDYNGIFQAGRHYLALKRDYTNLEAVLAQFLDPAVRRALTERAYEEIIRNPKYQYKAFVDGVDDMAESWFDTSSMR
jgi:hypothetical protein